MAEFKRGEHVRIVIDRALVAECTDETLVVEYMSQRGTHSNYFPIGVARVQIEAVAPAEWPPRPGDLWRDKHGSTWFAFWGYDAREVFMVPQNPAYGQLSTPTPDVVLDRFGPLTLVHREEATDR